MQKALNYLEELQQKVKRLEMSPLRKICYTILVALGIILIISYIATLMGSTYFRLPSEWNTSFISWLMNSILFQMSTFCIFAFCFDFKIKQLALITLGYYPICIITHLFPMNPILQSEAIPFLYQMIFAVIFKTNVKIVFLRYLFITAMMLSYQYITSPIKLSLDTNFITTEYNFVGPDVVLWYSLDQFLLYVILIIIRKERGKNNALVEAGFSEHEFFNVVGNGKQEAEVSDETMDRFNSLSKYQKLFIMIKIFAFQVSQMILILGICLIDNVLIEVAIIFPMFWIVRWILKNGWHSNNLIWCTITSLIAFYGGAKLTIPLHLSMLFPIITGVLIAYSIYRVAIYVEEHNNMKKEINKNGN